MLPVHLYVTALIVLKGLIVSVVSATISPGGGVVMVMSSQVTMTSPSMFIHCAVGLFIRPGISTMMQVRLNSDPATLLPEVLTVAEMG